MKVAVIKVAKTAGDGIASLLLPKLAAKFESAVWEKNHLREGWHHVTRESLKDRSLQPAIPNSTDRSLLLIHGTFSDAAGAFNGLATSTFFDKTAALYGDRIFAFNHFTVSRSPEDNARSLLASLPDKAFTFDVVTHSRGGLVIRTIVERAAAFGGLSRRFKLGRCVLVASPNEGTPLASPERWKDTVGWLANILEMFPDNPFTFGAELVANSLAWLARHASGDLPGLYSMDGSGDVISDLQGPPDPPPDAYSALVSNYNPTTSVLQRLIDTGVDQFFGSANDLVVPAAGGWRVAQSVDRFVPGQRIGCFGPGGNIENDSVTHLNFFSQSATADFLNRALTGLAQPLVPIDPRRTLPDRQLIRTTVGLTSVILGSNPAFVAPSIAPGKSLLTVEGTGFSAATPFISWCCH